MASESGPLPGGRRPAESWESLIERKVRMGIESGEFDNLPGTGAPLKLDDNPLEDPSWTMARRMLKSAGFSHPAIDSKRAIEEDIEAARRRFALRPQSAEFEQWCTAINQRIQNHNLQWHHAAMQLRPLDPDTFLT